MEHGHLTKTKKKPNYLAASTENLANKMPPPM